jgi:hypothetical protein
VAVPRLRLRVCAPAGGHPLGEFPAEIWPGSPEAIGGTSLTESGQTVDYWDVQLREWPSGDAWRSTVLATLGWVLRDGRDLVWITLGPTSIAAELSTAVDGTTDVVAALTSRGDFWCPFDPEQAPEASLGQDIVAVLRAKASL